MNDISFVGLVQNAALLLAAAFIFDVAAGRWRREQSSFRGALLGLALGIIGVTVMLTPWTFVPGIIFDTRSVLLGIAGLFFGPLPTALAMAMTAALRFYQGGAGVPAGLAVILTSGTIGIAWQYFCRRPLAEISWRELYLFGIVIHIVMLAMMFTLPWETALRVLLKIALPVIVIYPLATALLGMLIANRLRRERLAEALTRSEDKFHKAFNTSPDSININRFEDGMYVSINPEFTRITGYTEEEIIGKTSIEYNIWDNIEDRQKLVTGLTKDGEVNNLEAAFRMKGGDIRYGLMSASLIDLNGVPHILNITRDITDHKRAQEALKESENKYRLLADNAKDVIFVLDMDLKYTYVSPSVKILRGYEPAEVVKQPAYQTLTPSSRELAMGTLSEIMELEKSGHRDIPISRTLQLEMRRKDGTTVWTEVKVSFIRDENQLPMGILGVTRDITERRKAEEQLLHNLDTLRRAVNTTIQVMVSAVEVRDAYTAGHQRRSADLSHAIATEMGFSEDKIEGIHMAASIHDIGKLSVPAEILSKPTKLSDIEFSLIKEHSRKGYEILKDVESPWPLAEIVYQHHERMDGSGYPRNLKGEEIIVEARILAVADVVEAMASHRPYRPGLGIDVALDEIEKNRGIFYDNAVADACLRLFREKGYNLDEG
ncbi:MAG: PAS domain S-box protein [Syntrophales bacterium]|nr:PAS domain S-box protein [Syntrophales bacterium]